jgi:hypothetical protein
MPISVLHFDCKSLKEQNCWCPNLKLQFYFQIRILMLLSVNHAGFFLTQSISFHAHFIQTIYSQ